MLELKKTKKNNVNTIAKQTKRTRLPQGRIATIYNV
jgi:hypothetical protein